MARYQGKSLKSHQKAQLKEAPLTKDEAVRVSIMIIIATDKVIC
jgi:hypothetical protein